MDTGQIRIYYRCYVSLKSLISHLLFPEERALHIYLRTARATHRYKSVHIIVGHLLELNELRNYVPSSEMRVTKFDELAGRTVHQNENNEKRYLV
jgi:hypothetical protein